MVRKLNDVEERVLAGTATEAELASLDPDALFDLRSDPEVVQYRNGMDSLLPTEQKAEGDKKPPIKHVASTEMQDRYGDRILVSGWDLKWFRKNPQLFFNHASRGLPIGSVVKVGKGFAPSGGRALLTESYLHTDLLEELPPGPIAEWMHFIEALIRSRRLPASSVGFKALDVYRPKDEKEREKLGLGKYGVLFKKAELVEHSVVGVPANPEALLRSLDQGVQAGEYEQDKLDAFLKEFPMSPEAEDARLRESIRGFLDCGALPKIEGLAAPAEAEEFDLMRELDAQSKAVATMEVVLDADATSELVRTVAELAQHMNTLGETVESLRDQIDRGDADGAPEGPKPPARNGGNEYGDVVLGLGELSDSMRSLRDTLSNPDSGGN
jgi:hypothetical protein